MFARAKNWFVALFALMVLFAYTGSAKAGHLGFGLRIDSGRVFYNGFGVHLGAFDPAPAFRVAAYTFTQPAPLSVPIVATYVPSQLQAIRAVPAVDPCALAPLPVDPAIQLAPQAASYVAPAPAYAATAPLTTLYSDPVLTNAYTRALILRNRLIAPRVLPRLGYGYGFPGFRLDIARNRLLNRAAFRLDIGRRFADRAAFRLAIGGRRR